MNKYLIIFSTMEIDEFNIHDYLEPIAERYGMAIDLLDIISSSESNPKATLEALGEITGRGKSSGYSFLGKMFKKKQNVESIDLR